MKIATVGVNIRPLIAFLLARETKCRAEAVCNNTSARRFIYVAFLDGSNHVEGELCMIVTAFRIIKMITCICQSDHKFPAIMIMEAKSE
jgi:hypothetical protein